MLTGVKAVVGALTGSLGIIAEALHSLLDLGAALMTMFSVRYSDRPADASHQYGHGKIENLSAVGQTILLLATCGWITWEAVARMTGRSQAEVEANAWGVGVMLFSIAVDWHRARLLKRAAEKHRSQALEADALHFSSDILSSAMVIVGLILTRLGLPIADSLAALLVSAWIVVISIRLAMRAIGALLDSAPRGLREDIVSAASSVRAVEAVTQVRVREAGSTTFVDLSLVMNGDLTLEEAHTWLDEVEESVRDVIPGADVVIHAEPHSCPEDILRNMGQVRRELDALATEQGFRYRHVRLVDQPDGTVALFSVTFPGEHPLEKARMQTDAIEKELVRRLEFLHDAEAQIESVGRHTDEDLDEDKMMSQAGAAVRSVEGVLDFHDLKLVRAGRTPDGKPTWLVTVHVTIAPSSTVDESQVAVAAVQREVMQRLPIVSAVHVHQEARSVKSNPGA